MQGIRLAFRYFDPRPVLLDPRALIPVPSPAEILAEVEQLAAEVELDQADPTAVVSEVADAP